LFYSHGDVVDPFESAEPVLLRDLGELGEDLLLCDGCIFAGDDDSDEESADKPGVDVDLIDV
jgi:hypothetical protein